MKLEKCLHFETCKSSPVTMCGKPWSEDGCMKEVPMTNADYIRSMSDEELGKLLFDLGYEAYQYALKPNLKPIADTQDGWLEWLKQPSIWRGIDE